MPLHRVFKILFLCFLAAFALGCGSGSDDNFSNFQSFQNNDAPVRLRFQTVPQRAAGAPFGTINVAIIDFNGLVVTTDDRPVTISLTQPNGATLSGTTTVNAVNGVASFSGLSVDLVGTYTFTASAEGLLPAESAPFTITGGNPATVTFLQGPPAAPASIADLGPTNSITKGVAIDPPIVVEVRDAAGNLVTNSVTVTIVAGVDPTGTTVLSGNRAATVNGVATFDNLVVESGGGATVFVAAAGSGLAIASPSFVVADLFVYAVANPGAALPSPPFPAPPAVPAILRAAVFPPPMGPLAPAPVGGIAAGMGEIGNLTNPPGTFTQVTALTNHPTGSMYAAANLLSDGSLVLLELDPLATGMNANLISSTPITGINTATSITGMTVNPSDGTVYIFVANGTSPGLYTINIDTAAATFIGAPGAGFTVGNGIAWDPFANNGTGALFTSGGNGTTNGLSLLDVTTGAATEITGTAANLTTAVFDLVINPFDTSLIALLNGAPAPSANEISKTTGENESSAPLPAILPYVRTIAPYVQEPIVP